jgi:hypothetical protein
MSKKTKNLWTDVGWPRNRKENPTEKKSGKKHHDVNIVNIKEPQREQLTFLKPQAIICHFGVLP